MINKCEKEVVSLLIPIYNSEQYLKRTLNCVLAQSYKKIQLIMIDDGSKDRSEEVINETLPELKERLYEVVF